MLKYGLFLALCCVTSTTFASADFVGFYKCKGFDPYLNKIYSGRITVTQQNTVYNLDMDYDTGEKYKGTGGQYNATLMSVVFQDLDDPKVVGLEQYTFTKNKKIIQGYWVYLGKDKLGKEVCERQ